MDRNAQLEELDSLKSIYYSEEFQVLNDINEGDQLRAVFWAFLESPDDFVIKYLENLDSPEPSTLKVKYLPPIELQLTLPEDYPSKKPPEFVLSCQWLNKANLSKLCKKLDDIWEENDFIEIIYSWSYFLKNEIFQFLALDNELDITDLCFKHLSYLKEVQRAEEKKKQCTEKEEARCQWQKAEALEESENYQDGKPGTSEMTSNDCWRKYPYKRSISKQKKKKKKFDKRAILNLSVKMSPVKILENYNAEKAKVNFLRSFFLCNICFSEKIGKSCTQFKDCNHVFCKDCIESYFTIKIQDGSVLSIKCPEENCSTEALPSQVKEIVSEELFAKYDLLLLNNALNTLGDIIYCPRKICQYPVTWDPEEKMACCPNCRYVFCVVCKMVYHGIEPCQFKTVDFQKVVEDYENGSAEVRKQLEFKYGKKRLELLMNNSKAEGWIKKNSKPCPKCEVAIEKNYGCNKMVCWNCNATFCWLCCTLLDPLKPYLHYSDPKSRCLEKLFHLAYHLHSDEEDDEWDWV